MPARVSAIAADSGNAAARSCADAARVATFATRVGQANEPCPIGLQTFKDNAVFLDGGSEGACDSMHIYAWGHDG